MKNREKSCNPTEMVYNKTHMEEEYKYPHRKYDKQDRRGQFPQGAALLIFQR